MNKMKLWLITAHTNLHVGNENTTSYGIIDKQVQRDALTNLPCIHSSSLKGALNEFATRSAELKSDVRLDIFGSDRADSSKQNSSQADSPKQNRKKGNHIFMDANLLVMPRQCGMNESGLFELVSCDAVIELLKERLSSYNLKIDIDAILNTEKSDKAIETAIKVKLIKNEEFKALCDDLNLPIIARNCLVENKENLWYEQVVPSQSVFYTFIDDGGYGAKSQNTSETTQDNIEQTPETLISVLEKPETVVQIGANGSIGYGYCKFKKIECNENKNK